MISIDFNAAAAGVTLRIKGFVVEGIESRGSFTSRMRIGLCANAGITQPSIKDSTWAARIPRHIAVSLFPLFVLIDSKEYFPGD